MTDNTTPIATLFERSEDFIKTTLNLYKLKAIDKVAEIVSSLLSLLVVIMTVVLSIIIFSIGAAFWIGTYMGQTAYGFFMVGGFYLIISILFLAFKEKMVKYPVSNSIIKQMMKKKSL